MAPVPYRWLDHSYKIISILFLGSYMNYFLFAAKEEVGGKVACTIKWANIYLTVEKSL